MSMIPLDPPPEGMHWELRLEGDQWVVMQEFNPSPDPEIPATTELEQDS